jgi:hypothetical protein
MMQQQAVRPPPGIAYGPQQLAVQQQMPGNVRPGNDPYARLAWLETQHQSLFNDNTWLFNDNLRLNNEKARLLQENEHLKRQAAEQQQQLSNARPSQTIQQMEEQNQRLLAENRRLVEEKDKIAHEKKPAVDPAHYVELIRKYKDQNQTLLAENRRIIEEKEKIAREKQPAIDYKELIQKYKDKIAALKAEAENNSLSYVECGNDCRHAHGIKNVLCSGCFKPARDPMGRDRKGSTKVTYYDWDPYGNTVSISDSDEEQRPYDRSHYYEDMNTKQETRLEQDLFDWLQDWCLLNSDKIERRRVLERKENKPTVRKLVGDLRDVEDEIKKSYESLAGQKRKKRQLKRKLIVLSDKTPVVTADEIVLKKKLFTFCHAMSQPQQEYDYTRFPKLVDNKLLSEREAVKYESLFSMS